MSDAALPQPVEERSLLSDVGDLFVAPATAFASLLKKCQFWRPLLTWLGLAWAFQAVWLLRVDIAEFLRRQAELSGKPMPPMPEAALGLAKIMMWISAFVAVPVVMIVIAAVYLLVFRAFMGTTVTFKQTLTVVGWSMLCVSLVSLPLTFGTMALKGDWNQSPQLAFQASAALLLDPTAVPKWLYSLADSCDIFSLWTLFLLSTGFAVASRRSVASAAVGVVSPWAVYVILKVSLAALIG
jgi:hypothetical protein